MNTSANPLLAPWATQFGLPPFPLIQPAHFAPALQAAMAQHLAEIEAIATNPAAPSFANTIEKLQIAGRTLGRVNGVFANLAASLGGEELEAIDLAVAPKLAQHFMRVSLHPQLFARVAALYAQRDSLALAPDQARLLDRLYLGFVRSGAALGPQARARISEIAERLAVLHTEFGQNVLHDEKTWCLPLQDSDLSGLPQFVRDGAAQAARDRNMPGYVITLSRSLIEPFLSFSAHRHLREQAYKAWIARGTHPGPHDNRVLIPEILALRAEFAQLLGYDNYAAFHLADTMAKSESAVHSLLSEVWQPAKNRAAQEAARLTEIARAEGFNGKLAAWDWRYYAERLRASDYNLDEAALKPYFVFENIQQAAFDTASKLFGLSFIPRPDIALYHPDVTAYEVRDSGGHVGVFIADPFARANKRSGAWMSSFRDQENLDQPISPIIINNNNFAKSSPCLLSFDDATTLFHEFGHALHGLLSQVRYAAQSGTSVLRDFVEFPSQIFEHWFDLPETLQHYARHHQTGQPIDSATIERLLAARNFNQGFATVEYTAAALIDIALHRAPTQAACNIDEFESDFLAQIGMPPQIGMRHRPAHFQHLFAGDGYAAGYYSYLWAEVLDADGFEAFTEAGNPFDPALAARLRAIYAAGDTVDPMALYQAFRGRPPSTAALLRGRGLIAA